VTTVELLKTVQVLGDFQKPGYGDAQPGKMFSGKCGKRRIEATGMAKQDGGREKQVLPLSAIKGGK